MIKNAIVKIVIGSGDAYDTDSAYMAAAKVYQSMNPTVTQFNCTLLRAEFCKGVATGVFELETTAVCR